VLHCGSARLAICREALGWTPVRERAVVRAMGVDARTWLQAPMSRGMGQPERR
jgi:hypothetical protein